MYRFCIRLLFPCFLVSLSPCLLDVHRGNSTGVPEVWAGEPAADGVRVYRPPVPEFLIERVTVPAASSVLLASTCGTAIVLVVSGSGVLSTGADDVIVRQGSSFAIADGLPLTITATDDLLLFRVQANS